MGTQPSLYKLQGKIQHYQWGGFDFIPDLLGIEKSGQPYAEYWLGAHPAQPAEINVHGDLKNLNAWIEQDRERVLGSNVAAQYNSLPYLLKVLDVRQMLSIQVHPDKASATIAYEEENKQGIDLNAPHRNYKDTNHKPELMVALSDFWLLHGFKPVDTLQEILEAVPDFSFLAAVFANGNYKALYEHVMTMPEAAVNAVLQPLVSRLIPLYENGELQKEHEDFWAARAAQTFCKDGTYDRGIFSIYFFNLVHLKKGEGIYQPAGLPHAYLEGQNIEIMAASDNVLRAGLTDKHIDIVELMKHVRFEPTHPQIVTNGTASEKIYKSAAEEFELSSIRLKKNDVFTFATATGEIVLQLTGATNVQAAATQIYLQSGEAVFITAGAIVTIESCEAATLFRASMPAR